MRMNPQPGGLNAQHFSLTGLAHSLYPKTFCQTRITDAATVTKNQTRVSSLGFSFFSALVDRRDVHPIPSP